MPIVSVSEVMITKYEIKRKKKTKKKQTGDTSYTESVRAKWFRYLKSSEIGSIYEKWLLFLNELKAGLMLKFSLLNSLESFENLSLVWCESFPIYGDLK